MAVYKRNYKAYGGALTSQRSRFLVVTRYSYSRLFQSRLLMIFIAACLCYPLACVAFIYVANNPTFLLLLNVTDPSQVAIDGRFFYWFCIVQGAMAYLLTAVVGPGLVSPDLVNGGLPLYFCRPFSRAQYVLGKLLVLMLLLSFITWIPGMVLFSIEASLAGWAWLNANLWLAMGICAGMLVWIAVLSLMALALSARVKWRIAAGALVLGVVFAGAGLGTAINSVMKTQYGSLIDITQVAHTIWADLLRYDSGSEMPVADAWIVLAAAAAISLWMLIRRVRAFEVIR
jgi:ABC-2 type transport system permease protein